ncbi:MAG TPA: HD domain-containing protein [Cytophagaceae bacterium]|jgi:hypothetical protein
MNSTEVIYDIVKKLNLYQYNFGLVSHKARLNWRQEHPSFYDKIENVNSGVQFDKDKLLPFKGEKFADSKFIEQFINAEEPLLSVASIITNQNGRVFHIPMMNLHFDYPLSPDILRLTLNKIIENEYFLLKTDRYYHVYGSKLLNVEEWKLWNLKFLMVDSLVSPRYIGHSMERGYNLLRINSTAKIKEIVPYTFSEIHKELKNVELFAIVKHGIQRGKGGEMYFRHFFEVEKISKNIIENLDCCFNDEEKNNISMASILHDTIEDTEVDYEDIKELTNNEVADLVKNLTNDKRIPKALREKEYLKTISESNLNVQIIKLADILSNLREIAGSGDFDRRTEFCEKCLLFLNSLKNELKELEVYEEAIKLINEIVKHNNG